MVRYAVIAAACRTEQLITFGSDHFVNNDAQPALCRTVHPDHAPVGIVDDDHVVYLIQYHVEKTLCGNTVHIHDNGYRSTV
jgi:hypothetical protein